MMTQARRVSTTRFRAESENAEQRLIESPATALLGS
jgi:hypothetical protein